MAGSEILTSHIVEEGDRVSIFSVGAQLWVDGVIDEILDEQHVVVCYVAPVCLQTEDIPENPCDAISQSEESLDLHLADLPCRKTMYVHSSHLKIESCSPKHHSEDEVEVDPGHIYEYNNKKQLSGCNNKKQLSGRSYDGPRNKVPKQSYVNCFGRVVETDVVAWEPSGIGKCVAIPDGECVGLPTCQGRPTCDCPDWADFRKGALAHYQEHGTWHAIDVLQAVIRLDEWISLEGCEGSRMNCNCYAPLSPPLLDGGQISWPLDRISTVPQYTLESNLRFLTVFDYQTKYYGGGVQHFQEACNGEMGGRGLRWRCDCQGSPICDCPAWANFRKGALTHYQEHGTWHAIDVLHSLKRGDRNWMAMLWQMTWPCDRGSRAIFEAGFSQGFSPWAFSGIPIVKDPWIRDNLHYWKIRS